MESMRKNGMGENPAAALAEQSQAVEKVFKEKQAEILKQKDGKQKLEMEKKKLQGAVHCKS